MNALQSTYARFRAQGLRAVQALRSARTLEEWNPAGESVRLRTEEEQESYFDVYGEPDTKKERDEIVALIERDGCVCILGEYLDPITGKWTLATSLGMVIEPSPLDPFLSCYVPDIMRETLDALAVARSPERRIDEARNLIDRAFALLARPGASR
jgi:hypothetical protein